MLGSNAARTAVLGASLGIVATLLAWTLHFLPDPPLFSVDALARAHEDNAVLWLADLCPIGLALFGAWLGRHGDKARRALEAAALSEERARVSTRYQSMFQGFPMGLLIDESGLIVEANERAAQLFASDKGDLIGRSLTAMFPGFEARSDTRPTVWLTHDALGAERHLEVTPLWLLSEGLTAYVCRDVTENNDAQLRQRHLFRSLIDARDRADTSDLTRQRFLAGLAHELRTPLASMRGYLEIIAEEAVPEDYPPEVFRDLGRVRIATEQVLEAVEKVHDQAQAEAGEQFVYLAPVSLAEVFDEVGTTLRPTVRAGVSLKVVRPDPQVRVRADRHRLHQILLALGARGCRQAASGHVSIEANPIEPDAERPHGSVEITIEDTGPGIANAELKTLFSSIVTHHDSGDVGVAISHELATLMDGDLTGSSQLGRGTTFVLTLPQADRSPKEERRIHPRSSLGRGRVLLVSGDRVTKGLVEAGLGGRGTQVVSVATVPAAIQAADALGPSCLMVDLSLHGTHPLTLMRQLWEHSALCDSPLLGIAMDHDHACLLALSALLPASVAADRMAEHASQVAQRGAPVVVMGGGTEILEGLRQGGFDPVQPATTAEAEHALDGAGLLVVDLVAQRAQGLSFAMDRQGLPIIGLLDESPADADGSDVRRVVSKELRKEEHGVEEMMETVLRRIGTTG